MFLIDPFRFAGAPVATTTWDPADKSANVNLSAGNLNAQNPSGGLGYVRATDSRASGSYHFEVTTVAVDGGNILMAIAANGTGDPGLSPPLDVRRSGEISIAGSTVDFLNAGAMTAGDVLAFEVNATTGGVWIQRQGQARQGPYAPASFPAAAMQPFTAMTAGTNSVTANFGQSAFAITPTSGFVAWG